MKTISLIALSLACILVGNYTSQQLGRKVRILEKILLMLTVIENEIKYLNRPSDELISRLTQTKELAGLDFLPVCLSYLQQNFPIDRAWCKALSEAAYIDGETAGILMSFAQGFGKTDTEGQISNCRYHSELIRERLCIARKKRDKYSSLAGGLGILAGIGIIIILI